MIDAVRYVTLGIGGQDRLADLRSGSGYFFSGGFLLSSLFLFGGGFFGGSFFGFFLGSRLGLRSAQKLVGFFKSLGWPNALFLQLLEMVQLFHADNGSALGEFTTTQERPTLALANNQFAGALITFNPARFRRWCRR